METSASNINPNSSKESKKKTIFDRAWFWILIVIGVPILIIIVMSAFMDFSPTPEQQAKIDRNKFVRDSVAAEKVKRDAKVYSATDVSLDIGELKYDPYTGAILKENKTNPMKELAKAVKENPDCQIITIDFRKKTDDYVSRIRLI